MEVGSLSNDLMASRNFKATESNGKSNFNEVLDKTKNSTSSKDDYNSRDKVKENPKNESVNNTDKSQKDDKVENTDKTKETSKTKVKDEKAVEETKGTELDETTKKVSKGLEDLLALLSNMFNIPVEELTQKVSSLIEENGTLDLQGLLTGLKDILGDDVDFLSMPNMKEFMESAKVILNDINANLDEEVNVDEILNNLVEKLNQAKANSGSEVSEETMTTIADDVVSVEVTNTTAQTTTEDVVETEVVDEEIVEETTTTVTQTATTNQEQGQSSFTNQDDNIQQNIGQVNINTQSQVPVNQEIIKTENVDVPRNNLDTFKVVDQILDKMKVEVKADVSEIKIALKPAHLGDVTLKIATNNGIITAQFVADSQRVKELIESQFQSLEDTLKQQGIDVGSLSVEVGTGENPNQAYERESSQYRGNSIETVEEEILLETVSESLDESGNLVKSKVDYRV